jgi:hypothetical protein
MEQSFLNFNVFSFFVFGFRIHVNYYNQKNNWRKISHAMLHMYNTQSNKLSKTNQGHICQILCSMWTTSHIGIKYNHEHRKHHPLDYLCWWSNILWETLIKLWLQFLLYFYLQVVQEFFYTFCLLGQTWTILCWSFFLRYFLWLVKMFVYSTLFEIENVSQTLNQLLCGLICGFFKVFQFSRFFNILLWACEHMQVGKVELQKEPLILFIKHVDPNFGNVKKM